MISYDNNATTTSEGRVRAGTEAGLPSRCFAAPRLLSLPADRWWWVLCSTRLSDVSLAVDHSQHAIKGLCSINKKINFYETCLKQTTKIDWPDKIQLRFATQPHSHTLSHWRLDKQRNVPQRFQVCCLSLLFCAVANVTRIGSSAHRWRCAVYASSQSHDV